MTGLRLALVVAGLATAGVWGLTATQGANAKLETAGISLVHDFVGYYRPNAEVLGSRLAAGELPLWNAHQSLGEPFLASLQAGVLYPPNLIHALLPAQSAFVLLAALHLALAVVFAGALARSMGASLPGAVVAGMLYGGSARLYAEVWIPPALYAAAWMPALLLATERTAARPGPRNACLLAFALALQLLAGWPYAVALTALACGIHGGVVLLARTAREKRLPLAAVVALGGGVLGGLALAAPQLLPAFELLARSCRGLGSLSATQAVASLPGHDPVLFLQTLLREGGNSAIPSLPALALVVVALARPAADRLRPWTLFAVGLLTLAASFPHHLPVYDGLRTLPVLGDFRFPFRYRSVTLLVVATLAGLGVTGAERMARHRRWPGAVLVAALAAMAVIPSFWIATRSAPDFPRQPAYPASDAARLRALGAPPGEGFRRVFWTERTEKVRSVDGVQMVFDLEPLSLVGKARMLSFLQFGEARTVYAPPPGAPDAGTTQPFAGRLGLPDTPARAAIVDLLSADLVVTRTPHPWLDARYQRLGSSKASGAREVLYANPRALPHAYRVASAEAEPSDPLQALERLVSPDFDPRRRVLLDPLPDASGAPAAQEAGPGDARVEHYAPEHVRLRTRGPVAGFVVLTDTWFPGWQARVDGEPAVVLRANTLFRAVAVPAGEHVVELSYRPRSFRMGLAWSLAACVGLGASLLLERRFAASSKAGASTVPSTMVP